MFKHSEKLYAQIIKECLLLKHYHLSAYSNVMIKMYEHTMSAHKYVEKAKI